MLQKISFSDRMLFFWTFCSSKKPEKIRTQLFYNIIINNNTNVFEQQIRILEWFLKDHVSKVPKIQLWIKEINYILNYIQVENIYFK